MEIGVELSLYPLAREFLPEIRACIARLEQHGQLKVVTNSLSTQVFGEYERVMAALRQELRVTFESVGSRTERAVFVMKLLGPLPPA